MIHPTVRNILLSFADFSAIFVKCTKGGSFYRQPINDYFKWREKDKINYPKKFYYLKKKKLIRTFIKNKKTYIELTAKGKERTKFHFQRTIKIKRAKRWDGKWRIIIFDIPESRKIKRDILRKWLKHLGLIEVQKSVYAYPFDFKRELDFLVGGLVIYKYAKYIIGDIIQGEELIINKFLNKEILSKNDLRIYKRYSNRRDRVS